MLLVTSGSSTTVVTTSDWAFNSTCGDHACVIIHNNAPTRHPINASPPLHSNSPHQQRNAIARQYIILSPSSPVRTAELEDTSIK
jgi:hypothetical protein